MTSIHVFDSEDKVTPLALGNETRLASRGSVLVMVRGMGLHQGVRISQAQAEVAFNQDVKAIKPRAVEIAYLLYAMLEAAPFLLTKVRAAGHGTGVLSTDIIDGLQFVVPPSKLRARLSSRLEELNLKIAVNHRESRTLAALRDTLLLKLLSGELTVSQISRTEDVG